MKETRRVTIRLELRVSEEMHEFLQVEAHSRKLGFGGLLFTYIEERMETDRRKRRHNGPAKR